MVISWLFNTLFILVPLFFWPKTSEVFEFNKMLLVYSLTILLVASWTVKMIQKKKIIFRRTILDIPLLVFLATQALATIISIDPHTSLFGYYSRFHGGFLSSLSYCLLYWAFVSNMDKQKTIEALKYLLFATAAVAVYGVLEHFGHSTSCLIITNKFDVSCWVQDVKARVFATLGQPNWLAAWLVALIPLTWWRAIKEKDNWFWVFLSYLFFATILFTKSRSGILGLAAAFVLFWTVSGLKNKKQFFLVSIGFLILTGLFGTPWTHQLIQQQKEPQQEQASVQEPALETGGTESGDIRKIVWKGALDVWKANPLIGTGVETFAYSYYQFRPAEHNLTSEWDFIYNKAHNEYLNILANTGLVGMVGYLSLVGFSLYTLRKKTFLLAGYASVLVTNFFGFSVVVIGIIFFLYPAMALVLSEKQKTKDSPLNLKLSSGAQSGAIVLAVFAAVYLLLKVFAYWDADLAYNQAKSIQQNSNLGKAYEKISEAVKKRPKEAVYYDQLGRIETSIAVATEDKAIGESAIATMQKAVALSPRNVNIGKSQASAYIMLTKLDSNYLLGAIKSLERLKIIAPTDVKVRYHLGLAYVRVGNSQSATNALNEAIALKPNHRDSRFALALVLIDEGKKDEAKEQLKYILTNIDPTDQLAKEELKKL